MNCQHLVILWILVPNLIFGKDGFFGGTIYVSSSIQTVNNNLADIGRYGAAFGSLYVSSTAFMSTVNASSTLVKVGTTGSPTISASDYPTTGLYWSPAGFLATVNGTSVAGFISTGISPATHNTFDLGTYSGPIGALAFKDIFASGTAHFATSSIFQANTTSTISATTGVTGKGGQLILKDAVDGNCYALYLNGGVPATSQVTCP